MRSLLMASVLLYACSTTSYPPDNVSTASEAPCPLQVDLGPLYSSIVTRVPPADLVRLSLVDGGTLHRDVNLDIVTPMLPGGATEWYRADSQIRLTTGQIVSDVLDSGVGHQGGFSTIGYATAIVPASSVNYDAPLIQNQRYDIDIVVRHYVHTQCRWEIGVRDVGLVQHQPGDWIWAMQSPTAMAQNPGYPYNGFDRPTDDDGGPGHDTAAADTRR